MLVHPNVSCSGSGLTGWLEFEGLRCVFHVEGCRSTLSVKDIANLIVGQHIVKMKLRDLVYFAAVILISLLLWKISVNSSNIHQRARNIQRFFSVDEVSSVSNSTPAPSPKCKLSQVCPIDHFAFRITSGAAYIVGPKICFEGKTVMSGVLNNVGTGMNIVVVNGENGAVERFGFLNMINGHIEGILDYLKNIQPGKIVLVASFDDVSTKLTDEMRDIIEAQGSSLIKSVKHRDNWVFAGAVGMRGKSPFEKVAENDPTSNVYDGWPEVIEIGGCFPRNI